MKQHVLEVALLGCKIDGACALSTCQIRDVTFQCKLAQLTSAFHLGVFACLRSTAVLLFDTTRRIPVFLLLVVAMDAYR